MNQNEPIFLNLYIRDTEKSKTFVLSTTYQITIKMIAEKLLIFVEEHYFFNIHNLLVSNFFRIFATRFCVSYVEIQKIWSDLGKGFKTKESDS